MDGCVGSHSFVREPADMSSMAFAQERDELTAGPIKTELPKKL